MGAHLIDNEFQSDKYPTTPRGKVPLSVKDKTAQDLLWEYAQRHRAIDAEFSADLETALIIAGYTPPPPGSKRIAVASQKRALYFGWKPGAGHFLQGLRRDSLDPQSDCPGFPWTMRLLDTGLLENRKVPDDPDGRVHCVCGGTPIWIAFVWWDRSGDARGKSNSGFYVQGFHPLIDLEEAFAYACAQWPQVVERQLFPLALQPMPKG